MADSSRTFDSARTLGDSRVTMFKVVTSTIANERGYDSMRVVMHGSDVQRLGSASAAH